MKKTLLLVTASLFMFLFTGCFSSSSTNINYKERGTQGTPENSVVFYGFFEYNTVMEWSQSDSEYAPDYQILDTEYIVSAPVAPGSRYRLEYVNGSYSIGNTTYYWNNRYSMQENGFDIKIPDEPGLYFIGYNSGPDSYKMGKIVPLKTTTTGLFGTTAEKAEMECLQEAYDLYRGTAWAPLIKERIKELQK